MSKTKSTETMIETCVLTLGELIERNGNKKNLFEGIASKVLNPSKEEFKNPQYKLTIPFYQRAYVWSEKMVKIMLEDIDEQRKEGKRYLLGSLIIHIDKTDENVVEFNIVDGQQRLTTLDLILRYLQKSNNNSASAENDLLDDSEFNHNDSKIHISQNYRHIESWFKARENIQSSIETYLKEHIEFVCVFTDSLDDAFIFFDSANAKGKRLEGYDLIKAFHLRALEDYNTKAKVKDEFNLITAYFAKEFEKLATDSENLKILFNETLTPARQWLRHNSDKVSYQIDIYGEFCAEIPQRFKHESTPLVAKDSLGILQNFVGGADFFEYLSHFHGLYEKLRSVEFYKELEAINWANGFIYNRYIYIMAVLIYLDKFPNGRVDYMLRLVARAVFALRCSESRIYIQTARGFAKEILPLIYYASFEQELEANLCNFIDNKLGKEKEFKDNEIDGGKGRYIEIMSGEYAEYKIQPHTPKGE